MVIGDPSRAEAIIDLDAIAANLEQVGRIGVPVMAVVKADAYGHGVERVAPWLRHQGASWLGVALPSEALMMRARGDRGRILAWLWSPGDQNIVDCVAADVDLSISDAWALAEVVQAAKDVGRPARVHLKVDTGLSRNGAAMSTWPALLQAAKRAQDANQVSIVGVWSHLGSADSPEASRTDDQLRAFHVALDEAAAAGIEPEVRHLANSAGALTRSDLAFDMVRSGIALYGLTPGEEIGTASELGLRPAMTLRARLAHVKPLASGAWVSYGHTWQAPTDTVMGLVPIGYGDGIARRAGNAVEVWVGGRRCPVIGRVAMDQCVIDLGIGAQDRPGDEVLCFGPGHFGEPSADEWAQRIDTIGYEITTGISGRVPRRYLPDDAGTGQ